MNLTLLGFIRKEFLQVLRDPRMRVILFVLPVVQLTLFGVALSTEVKNIRLAGLFGPGDTLSREIYTRAVASGWFVGADVQEAGPDPFAWIQMDRADAVFVAPPLASHGGLATAIGRGQTQLQLLINATNVIRAQQIEGYFKAVLQEILAATQSAPPPPLIRFDVRILYNPAMETAVFMVPGVMSMILCVLTIILTAMSLAKEKETGTFEMLVAAPVSTSEILFGKTVPYILLAMLDVFLILIAAILIFGVPMKGSLLVLAAAALVFVCTTVSIGTLISTLAHNQQQAMMGGFLFLFPAILLSGIMFPVENMPDALKVLAYLNPLKYFVALLRGIMLKGGNPEAVSFNIGVLAAMAVLTVAFAFRRFKHTLE